VTKREILQFCRFVTESTRLGIRATADPGPSKRHVAGRPCYARREVSPSLRIVGWGALACSLAACGDPTVVTIARDDAGGGSEPSPTPRGRVQVVDGRIVTDRGSSLRGVALEADQNVDFELYADAEAARPAIRSFFRRLTTEAGLNTFEIYLESYHLEAGTRAEFADVLVEESGRAGAYLLFGPGSGPIQGDRGGSGWFDPDAVAAFWSFYAPRYAAQTHVIYQLQKVPERNCNALWNDASIELERSVHAIIRSGAPDTHIAMFSYGETPTAEAFQANVEALQGLEWQNDSVAFHAHDECVPISEVALYPRDLPNGGRIALLVPELPPSDWSNNQLALEADGIGWMHYRFIATDSNLGTFRTEHDQAGVSWCPDFGTWPMDSATCENP
jgi:hypothetical protein